MNLDDIFLYTGLILGLIISVVYIASHFHRDNLTKMIGIFFMANLIVGGIRLLFEIFLIGLPTHKTLYPHIIIGSLITIFYSVFGIVDFWKK